MATLLLDNVETLVTVGAPEGGRSPRRCGSGMGDIGVIRHAAVAIDGDRIEWVGAAGERTFPGAERLDLTGRTVMPGFVDSHTHMVFAGDRSGEFALRLRGASYQEIAAAGGGILNTMRAVRAASAEELAVTGRRLMRSAFEHGTTTVEIKSGYGLDTSSELRLLEAIALLKQEGPVDVMATFLGAHDVPPELQGTRETYIDEVTGQMMPEVARRGLADFCDVFTDTGYYTIEESERIFEAGLRHGLRPRVHADELSSFGAAEMAARIGALSADHLLCVSDEGIDAMRDGGVVATLLPGTAFYLRLPYAPARRMIERGSCVALATDCNPGTNMCENMAMVLALACMGMRMTVEEAICAATLNGAAALGVSHRLGSIEAGKQADLVVFNVPDYPAIVYHYGINHVEAVIKRGKVWTN